MNRDARHEAKRRSGGDKKLSVWLTPSQQSALAALCEREGRSQTRMVQWLIEQAFR